MILVQRNINGLMEHSRINKQIHTCEHMIWQRLGRRNRKRTSLSVRIIGSIGCPFGKKLTPTSYYMHNLHIFLYKYVNQF
jgi:hypothetical protein